MTAEPIPQRLFPARGYSHAVASSNPSISAVGSRVLGEGGNAVDASLAMAAMSWLVLPGQAGVGGDVFAIVREPDGRVWTVNGSGEGPAGARSSDYRDRGLETIPQHGAESVTVPGAMGAIRTLHREGATRDLSDLWAPAIHMARNGFACTEKTARDIAQFHHVMRRDRSMARDFLPRGNAASAGERIRQPDLADSMIDFAADPESFYRGTFADRALEALNNNGAQFDGREWARALSVPVESPITTRYQGWQIHQTPLPSAGWMVLHQARICDGIVGSMPQLGADAIHWLASASRVAFRERFAHAASDNDAWQAMLSDEQVEKARREIEAGVPASGPTHMGDTTCTVCVDDEGRAVAFIQSLAFTFGAVFTVPGTGVVLNNRLSRGSYLIPGHPNELRPRRKPLHTLNAWVADGPDKNAFHVGACPGGDGQVQWNMQIISHLLDHGDSPQDAVARPRFITAPGSDAQGVHADYSLTCESGIDPRVLEDLAARGHTITSVPVRTGGPGGSAMVISADLTTGTFSAGADPRMDGVALAL